MSYEKQTWVTGDTITAEKLNHIEDGIDAGGGGALIVNLDAEHVNGELIRATLDKTYAEIVSAINCVFVMETYGALLYLLPLYVGSFNNDYRVGLIYILGDNQYKTMDFLADSDSGVLTWERSQ